MSLWIPDQAASELRTQQIHAQVDRHRAIFREWNQKLKALDPNLELVRASENTTVPELKPGYWHVIRNGTPPMVIVHEGPNGEYRDPDSGLLEALRKGDMWSDRSQKERERKHRAALKAEERQREHEHEERVDEFMDRYRHRFQTKIAVPKGV